MFLRRERRVSIFIVRSFRIARALSRFYLRSVPDGWHRRAPYLPIPSSKYVRWRMETAYGRTRPGARLLLADLWQFGGWLADFESRGGRPPAAGAGR